MACGNGKNNGKVETESKGMRQGAAKGVVVERCLGLGVHGLRRRRKKKKERKEGAARGKQGNEGESNKGQQGDEEGAARGQQGDEGESSRGPSREQQGGETGNPRLKAGRGRRDCRNEALDEELAMDTHKHAVQSTMDAFPKLYGLQGALCSTPPTRFCSHLVEVVLAGVEAVAPHDHGPAHASMQQQACCKWLTQEMIIKIFVHSTTCAST